MTHEYHPHAISHEQQLTFGVVLLGLKVEVEEMVISLRECRRAEIQKQQIPTGIIKRGGMRCSEEGISAM